VDNATAMVQLSTRNDLKRLFFAETRSVSPSPSLPPISREQALLESFFHALSQFAFDKAKDQVVSYGLFVLFP